MKPDRLPLRYAAVLLGLALLLFLPTFIWLVPAPTWWQCLQWKFMATRGFDLHVQSMWVTQFADELASGILYPRWLIDMYAGNGSPVFFYYPPVAYYITALFRPIMHFGDFAYPAIAASAFCAVCFGGVTFFFWMREEGAEPGAALLGTLLYMASPYNVGINFYHTLLFSSVWAFAWVPLLMRFARRLAQGRDYALAGFAVMLALLVMTNLPMTLLFGPMAVGYYVMCLEKAQWQQQMLRLAGGLALGFSLTSIYLLPALLCESYTILHMHWDAPHNQYTDFMFVLGFRQFNQQFFTIGWMALLLLTGLYAFAIRKGPPRYRFFLVASLVALFLSERMSLPVWGLVSILKIEQFSIRFFIVPFLCVAILATAAAPRLAWLGWLQLPFYALAITFIIVLAPRQTMENIRLHDAEEYTQYQLTVDQHPNYMTADDLMPRYYSQAGRLELLKHYPLPQVETVAGDAKAEILRWRPRDIAFAYHASTDSSLRIRQFDFPGFTAMLDGTPLPIHREDGTGQIRMDVPQGEGTVTLTLEPLVPEMLGRLLTLAGLGALALNMLLTLRRRSGAIASVTAD